MGQKLPTEILIQVFLHLSQKDLRKCISLVCRKWCKIAQESNLVEGLHVNLLPSRVGELLNDFKLYTTFGQKIKVIHINEQENCNREDLINIIDSLRSSEEINFNSIIQSCANLEELKIRMHSFPFFILILADVLLTTEKQYKPQLSLLQLDFTNIFNSSKIVLYKDVVKIDMMKLIYHTIPYLRHLIFYSSTSAARLKVGRIAFVIDGLYFNNAFCSIRTIKIVLPHSIIDRACLDHIVSGHFESLEELELFLKLVDSLEEFCDINTYVSIEDNDDIWIKIRNFCSSSLRDYSVKLVYNYGSRLFAINNREDEEDIVDGDDEHYFLDSIDYN